MSQPGASTELPTSPGPGRALWLAPLLTAFLLYLSYFPAAIGWLAWVAWVPFLALTRLPGRPRRLYLAAYVGGCALYFPALQWFRVAHPAMYVAWITLAVYCAAYFPLVLALTRSLSRRTSLPLVLLFPTAWVAGEYCRYGIFGSFASLLLGSHQHDFPGGFSWYFLGHSQHDFLEVIQIADLTGAYGVSFLVAAVNALVFEALWARRWFRQWFSADDAASVAPMPLLIHALGVGALLLGTFGYGRWRLGEADFRPGPRLALLQTNGSQALRNEGNPTLAISFRDLMDLTAEGEPDLVVTPETSYPGTWRELRPGEPNVFSRRLARDMTRHVGAAVLLGMGAEVYGDDGVERAYNSAILLDREGQWRGRYDKVHLVPFGEYVPVRRYLPFLRALVPYDFDYAVVPGESFTRFELAPGREKYTFGTLICYEDTDPAMARAYVTGAERKVDFLLNISNDGWFDGTSEHEQHLATCRFRAVECRRPVARAVNMGISAVIDGNGRVLRPEATKTVHGAKVWTVPENAGPLPIGEWSDYKAVAGVLFARLPLDGRESFYARQGDWFAAGCLLLLLTALALSRLRHAPGGAA